MTTTITDLDDFKALEPFFRIIEKGLDGVADGGHFFDLLAENVTFDDIITMPGYPRHVEGLKAVAELYRPYGRARMAVTLMNGRKRCGWKAQRSSTAEVQERRFLRREVDNVCEWGVASSVRCSSHRDAHWNGSSSGSSCGSSCGSRASMRGAPGVADLEL